ncbi:MAG: NUDIX hydrolase [Methanobacteriaceae archaeon]|nr:MAG: DNA mismatch repair protein MutT [Methanobacterium sp. BRmetb2]MCC7557594.1 NUDIX hydrolase [Methanobacteriaceae archaeon]
MKRPLLTVDAAIFCGNESIILIKRKNKPFRGYWALPGGFVECGETVESAVIRESKEETGLDVNIEGIVGVYSDPDRDPRGYVVSICFLATSDGDKLKADTDASEVNLFNLKEIANLELAFDHEKIIKDAIKLKIKNIEGN